jgi:hypothetical protein
MPRRIAEQGRISDLPNLRGLVKIYLKSLPNRENISLPSDAKARSPGEKRERTKIKRTIQTQFFFNSPLLRLKLTL